MAYLRRSTGTVTGRTLDSPTLTTPALGTPASGVMTNMTGAVEASVVDDSITLAKMAGLARGKLIVGDSSGNPSALAVGSANEVLTHDGTDFDWAAASGGFTHASQWRLIANFSGNANPITNVEEVDTTPGFGVLGASMTESSGTFTFPSTGYWWIGYKWSGYSDAAQSAVTEGIWTTTDNSTYTRGAFMQQASIVPTGTTYNTGFFDYIFDCTNTSTHKIRFGISDAPSGQHTAGSDTEHRTNWTFMRLAGT